PLHTKSYHHFNATYSHKQRMPAKTEPKDVGNHEQLQQLDGADAINAETSTTTTRSLISPLFDQTTVE
ncbi:MAG: hypothetical protein WBB85_04700, partial [Albidovulum sp.]|uniref:hypothetical protein n=1 Tax=Albidovulum sp. TaxID=1872424 RepID=UPI003C8B5538